MKTCIICNEKKSEDEFLTSNGTVYNRCTDCIKSYQKKYRNKLKNNKVINKLSKYYNDNLSLFDTDMTLQYISSIISLKCDYSNQPISLVSNIPIKELYIDRIDRNLKYSKDNIIFVSKIFYKLRGDNTYDEYKKLFI